MPTTGFVLNSYEYMYKNYVYLVYKSAEMNVGKKGHAKKLQIWVGKIVMEKNNSKKKKKK